MIRTIKALLLVAIIFLTFGVSMAQAHEGHGRLTNYAVNTVYYRYQGDTLGSVAPKTSVVHTRDVNSIQVAPTHRLRYKICRDSYLSCGSEYTTGCGVDIILGNDMRLEAYSYYRSTLC